ncbi:MAG TPA: hypothetical protein VIF64_01225 [Pyrinomonadaceae bacterium]|jgi:hypothetical protein
MANPKLTIALSHYDRHVPFFDGTVRAESIDLNVLIVGQSDKPLINSYRSPNSQARPYLLHSCQGCLYPFLKYHRI